MSNTVIAGKPSNTVGEKDSTLVLRGRSIKILWGNKFIDLIKNGKINVDTDKILKTADSVESITSDGIYLVGESVWAVIGGTKIQIAGDSATTYVSYLVLLENTPELKNRALTNIGFYYDTYELALKAGLTSGLIYVQGDNKLYIILDGILSEYLSAKKEEIKEEEITVLDLYIEGHSLWVRDELYITCENSLILAHKQLILENSLLSKGATSNYGFKLYMKNGKSYLEIDNIIWRNLALEKAKIYPIKYYQEENIIISAVNALEDSIDDSTEDIPSINQLLLTLLHSDKYQIGDILTTSILIDLEVEIPAENGDTETVIKQILKSVDFVILEIKEDIYKVKVITIPTPINTITILLLINKSIFYKLGYLPVSRIQDHNYDLFEAEKEHTLENIRVRIGTISEIETTLLEGKIGDFLYSKDEERLPKLGLYSYNSILYDSKIILPNIFISESKLYSEITTKIGEIPLDKEIVNSKKILDFTEKKQGIYSDNAVLLEPKIIKSEEYCTVFKDLEIGESEDKYPKYDDDLKIPSNPISNLLAFNLAVPNVEWVKKMMDLLIPIGTVVMWRGDEIPDGWEICYDLVGKFIKAGEEEGDNEVDTNLNKNNEISLKLTSNLLPYHKHPHSSHRHSIGTLSGETDEASIILDLGSGITNITYETTKGTVNSSESGDLLVVTGLEIKTETGGGGLVESTHSHSVFVNGGYTGRTTSVEIEPDNKEPDPLKFKIEPHAYSLIFIQKVKNFADL